MPFSIVMTKEGSSHLISLVPSTWVIDENLFWPRVKKNSELENLRRNEHSIPGTNWKKLKCKIKVNGVDSFSEGIKLEELYSKFDDTEDEERYYKTREIKRKHPTILSVTEELLNLNSDFNMEKNNEKPSNETDKNKELLEIINNNVITSPVDVHVSDASETETIENTKVDSEQHKHDENLVTLNLSQLNELIAENGSLSTENKLLKESISRFENMELQTKRSFSVIQVQLDKLFELLHNYTRSEDKTAGTASESINEEISHRNIEFPITSKEHLDLLEESLADENFRKSLVKKFSEICGTSGTQKLRKIGILLVKCMFTDELLYQFTWKGIKGCTKEPFLKYIKTRDFFYRIVRLAATSCSANECDLFLQNSAIKHSGQRLKRKSSEVNKNEKKKQKGESTVTATLDDIIQEEEQTNETEDTDKQIKKKNETEIHDLNNAENETDDTPGTSFSIEPSKRVTVLSDVKINEKLIDLKNVTKAANISSSDLSNSIFFEKNTLL